MLLNKEAERTYVMKENFMSHHEAGESISEIAARYNLSKVTVYRHLQEIADKNGVTRESLLQIVRTPTPNQIGRETHRIRVTAQELDDEFNKVEQSLGSLIDLIDNILEEEKKNAY